MFFILLPETTGAIFSSTAKKYRSIRPSQKSGIVALIEEAARIPWSNAEPLYLAESTANGMDISSEISVATSANSSVAGKRERISSETGRPV